MEKKCVILLIACMFTLTGCSDKNASMYEVKKTPVKQEEKIPEGYGTVEAQIAEGANTDIELGTKHVVVVDGIPYAELDGQEQPGLHDQYTTTTGVSSTGDTAESSKEQHDNINNINNSIEDVLLAEQEKAEVKSTTEGVQSDDRELLQRFGDICYDNGWTYEVVDGKTMTQAVESYGIRIDKQDQVQKMGIAADNESASVFILSQYKNATDLAKGFSINNRTAYTLDNAELLESDGNHSIIEVKADNITARIELKAISKGNEYYLINVTYRVGNTKATKLLDDIIDKL